MYLGTFFIHIYLYYSNMPEFIPRTPAPANNVRFFNWPGAGEQISETLEMTHAAVIPPGVSTIHVGGQVGLTPQGTVPADLEEEIKEAFEHIELSLRAAGLTGTKQEVWAYVYKVSWIILTSGNLCCHDVIADLSLGPYLPCQHGRALWGCTSSGHDRALWCQPANFYWSGCV